MAWLVVSIARAAAAAPGAVPSTTLPLLTRVEQIRKLPPDQAARAYPVRVQGIVTYRGGTGLSFYFQDATRGIYVRSDVRTEPPYSGQLVTVEGVTGPGDFAPVIVASKLHLHGPGIWPKPYRPQNHEITSGAMAAQWVELDGVVMQATRGSGDRVDLRIRSGGLQYGALVEGFHGSDPEAMVDSEIRLRGACGSRFNSRRQFTGFRLLLASPDQITTLTPAPANPYGSPLQAVNTLLRFTEAISVHRVRIQGIITYYIPGSRLFVQDATQGIQVYTTLKVPASVGDRVEVVGFPNPGDYSPVLQNAIFRRLDGGRAPQPLALSVEEARKGNHDAELITVDATLLGRRKENAQDVLELKMGDTFFDAILPRDGDAHFEFPRNQSTLRIAGVCRVQVDESRKPRSFQILTRTTQDISVVRQPPLWTLERAATILGAIALLFCAVLGWVVTLKRQVRSQTATIREFLQKKEALQRRYQDLFENANDIVYAIDTTGRILSFNKAGEQVTGYSREEAQRMNLTDLVPPEAGEALRKNIEEIAAGRAGGVSELEIINKDGHRRALEVNTRVTRGEDGQKELQAIARDITERKKIERELQRAKEAAERASRAKSDFLASMSHELRTPLNSIIGFSELMLDGKVSAVSEDQRDFLGDILTSARHLLQLINDMLDLSKVEAGKMEFHPETIDSGAIVHEVTDLLSPLWSHKHIHMVKFVDGSLRELFTDPARLKQVLYNYLSNAIKFTPEGGRIGVAILPESDTEFRLEVSDSGIGISRDQMPELFKEFRQVGKSRRQGQGTGLGLALTRRIVEAQGGRVEARSTLGEGSTFSAILPRMLRGAAPLEAPSSKTQPRRVLVIDDDPIDAGWLSRTLTTAGYAVVTAASGAEAIQKCQTVFDAITLDLLLPDMSGWEVLHKIRSGTPNTTTPIIVVSVVAEQQLAADFPVQDFLTKPVKPEDLLGALERAGVPGYANRTVLVVDDDDISLQIMDATLSGLGYRPICCSDAASGLSSAATQEPAAIILDLIMEQMDGFEFLEHLRARPAGAQIPVIIWTAKELTALDHEQLAALAQGVVLKRSAGLSSIVERLQILIDRNQPAARPRELAEVP